MSKSIFWNVLTGGRLDSVPDSIWRIDDARASAYLCGPAFFDPQINGFAGVDFQNPDVTSEEILHAVARLRLTGCAHFLLTIITAGTDFLKFHIRHLASLLDENQILRQSILGFHLEGPFISSKAGFHGAHPPEHVCVPDWGAFSRLQELSGGRIKIVTLAPELDGSALFIQRAVTSNVLVSLGHTDARLDQIQAAVQAGARMFTHLGNGCPEQMHRHDNIIQRVLAVPGLLVSLIPDGIHLPPFVLANLARCLGVSRTAMTTDAMSAAGAPAGEYTLGTVRLAVGEDRVVRHPSGRNFAGSCLTPLEGFFNLLRFGGYGTGDAWSAWIRLREYLFPGIETPWLMLPFPGTSAESARDGTSRI